MIIGVGVSIAPRFMQDVLYLHPSGTAWSSITVTPDGHHGSFTLRPNHRPLKVSPIVYGPYLLRIEYADGRVVWATFWHYDAGVRKRLDLYIDRSPSGVRFKQVVNQSEMVFTGSVHAEQTRQEKPFALDGP